MSNNWLPVLRQSGSTWTAIERKQPRFQNAAMQTAYKNVLSAMGFVDDENRKPDTLRDNEKLAQYRIEAEAEIRRFFDRASDVKEKESKSAAYDPFEIFFKIFVLYRHITMLALYILISIIGVAFEILEIYPHSITKPQAVQLVGAVSELLGMGAYIFYTYCSPQSIRPIRPMQVAKWIPTVLVLVDLIKHTLKNYLVSVLVPESTISSQRDIFNFTAPTLMAAIHLVLQLLSHHSEEEEYLPFTQLGEQFACIKQQPMCGKGLTIREKRLLLETLLWKPAGAWRETKQGASSRNRETWKRLH